MKIGMADTRLFRDRRAAGRELAESLVRYRGGATVVLGLPRGGVVVADEIAHALGAPVDVCVVKKLGAPIQPELGLGAVAEGGETVIDRKIVALTRTTPAELAEIMAEKELEIADKVRRFRRGRPARDVAGKTVVVVDDGVATGGTARAALRCLRRRGPARLVMAVPVGAAGTLRALADEADDVVCPHPQDYFQAVGLWYRDFDQVSDDEVVAILDRAWAEKPVDASADVGSSRA